MDAEPGEKPNPVVTPGFQLPLAPGKFCKISVVLW
jgi:hypothetical protein